MDKTDTTLRADLELGLARFFVAVVDGSEANAIHGLYAIANGLLAVADAIQNAFGEDHARYTAEQPIRDSGN